MMKSPLKVTQIITWEKRWSDGSGGVYLVALREDGTIWRLIEPKLTAGINTPNHWVHIPGPTEEVE